MFLRVGSRRHPGGGSVRAHRRWQIEARADLVGHDLDLGAVSTVVGLPAPLLEAPGHDYPHPLGEGEGHVSARSRQQMTSKNEVDSCHSWVLLSCQRRLTATPSCVAWPSLV